MPDRNRKKAGPTTTRARQRHSAVRHEHRSFSVLHKQHRHLAAHHARYGWYLIGALAGTTLALILGTYNTVVPHYPKPVVDYVDPFLVSGNTEGRITVHVFGNNFQQGAQAVFSHFPALKTYVVAPTELVAVIDAATLQPGWYDILIRNYDRQYVIFHSGLGVRGGEGKIPDQYYAIQNGSDGIVFATAGRTQQQGNTASSYDNYPNISVGSYTVTGTDMTSSAQTFADRYDYLFGTFPTGTIHTLNSHVQQFPYADMTEFNNGIPSTGRDGHTDAKISSWVSTYNATHDPDIQAEDFYLHAKCDCDMLYGTSGHCQTYSAADPKCTQTAGCPYSFITGTKTQYKGWNPSSPGTPNSGCIASTAPTRAASRMMSAYLPQWDVPNYALSQLADYDADTFQNENIYWAGGSSAVSGVNFDTVVKDNPSSLADGLQMSWEYWGADVRNTVTPAQPFYDYFALQQSVRSKLSATAGQSSFRYTGNVITIPNEYPASIYTPDTLTNVQDNFVEIFFDHYKNSANTYQGECGTWKSLIDETKNKGEKFFLNSYERVGSYCSGGSSYDCRTSRGKIESLAEYYLLQNNLTTYLYDADVAPFTPDEFWNAAVSVDLGQPTTAPSGARDIFGNTGTDNFYNFDDQSGGFACPIVSTTPSNVVYARSYTNGLVLVKHRYDWADSVVYGDESGSDTTKKDYALGAFYHPVNADGTLGSATNTVNLSNSEGAILLKNRAPSLSVPSSRSATEGQTLSFDVTVSDPDGDVPALGATGLPSGSTYLGAGQNRATFSWTPDYTQAGTYTLNFTGSDSSLSDAQSVIVTVADSNRAPVLGALPGLSVPEGQLLAVAISATDADVDPVTLSAGTLPSGATMTDHNDNTATFRWQPTYDQAGTYSVTVTGSDGKTTSSASFSITVTQATPPNTVTNGVNDPPEFIAVSNKTVKEGTLLAVAIAATDPEGDKVHFTGSHLPRGASFADYGDGTATFRWLPSYDQAGTYSGMHVEASDGSLASSIDFSVTVLNTPIAGGAFVDSKPFYAFAKNFTGGANLAVGNVTGDGREEIVVGAGPGAEAQVRVFSNDGKLLGAFYPYGRKVKHGVSIATCDLNGDSKEEILTVPGPGALPRVRVFDAKGKLLYGQGFLALLKPKPNGATISCGDLDGDRKAEIVVGPPPGVDPTVFVYTATGKLLRKFSAYSPGFRGGVVTAVVDVTGDRKAEILTAPTNGSSQIQIFSGNGKRLQVGFLAFGQTFRGGVDVGAGDTNGDGRREVVVVPTGKVETQVRVYSVDGKKMFSAFLAYPKNQKNSAQLAIGDIDGDGTDDIVTIPGAGTGPLVREFDLRGGQL